MLLQKGLFYLFKKYDMQPIYCKKVSRRDYLYGLKTFVIDHE